MNSRPSESIVHVLHAATFLDVFCCLTGRDENQDFSTVVRAMCLCGA